MTGLVITLTLTVCILDIQMCLLQASTHILMYRSIVQYSEKKILVIRVFQKVPLTDR